MSKVIPLRRSDSVDTAICEAADSHFAEVVIVGKLPSGGYRTLISESENLVAMLGALKLLEQEIMDIINENSE